MNVSVGSVQMQLSPPCTENPNKITGLWVITPADCSNMSDVDSEHGNVDEDIGSQMMRSVFPSAFIIITLSYNYTCEGPEDNRCRSGLSVSRRKMEMRSRLLMKVTV